MSRGRIVPKLRCGGRSGEALRLYLLQYDLELARFVGRSPEDNEYLEGLIKKQQAVVDSMLDPSQVLPGG